MSMEKGNVIPVATNINKFLENNWNPSTDFPGSRTVLVAFRTIGSYKHEYVWNRRAANFTSKPDDVFPAGRMCHAEMLLPLGEDRYVKCSVIKKNFNGKDAKGNIKWKSMGVHCKITSPSEWKNKYVFMTLTCKRSHILKALKFFLVNNGQKFNFAGYYAALIIPGGIGVKQFDERLMKKPRSYFCTELIVTGIQCLASADTTEQPEGHWKKTIWTLNPATSHPNGLHRLLTEHDSQAFPTTPLGKEIGVDFL